MKHQLRVLVRIDIDRSSATVEVCGCLTEESCHALFPLLCRIHEMTGGSPLSVDLSYAQHIERPGLDLLQQFSTGKPVASIRQDVRFAGVLAITAPANLPRCMAADVCRDQLEVAA